MTKRGFVKEELRVTLEKIDPDLPAVLDAIFASDAGDMAPLQAIGMRALADEEILRRRAVKMVLEQGLVITERHEKGDGEVFFRKMPHPLLDYVRRAKDGLGFRAAEMNLTKKARGEGEKNAAATRFLERQARLRGSKQRMLPPPEDPVPAVVKREAVTVEVIPDAEAVLPKTGTDPE